MKKNNDLTQKFVKSVLDYSPETGEFTWIKPSSRGSHMRTGDTAGCNVGGYKIIHLEEYNKASHLAYLIMTGEWPKWQIYYKNEDGTDTRWDNLQHGTRLQSLEKDILEYYSKGYSLRDTAFHFNIGSGNSIKKILIDNNVERRDKKYNKSYLIKNKDYESVFCSPTPEALYWVGFLMADGNVYQPKRGNPQITCEIQRRDKQLIYKLQDYVGAGNITTRMYNKSPMIRWKITSKKIAKTLAKWGVVPRKGKTNNTKPLNEAADSVDFWRGMIDGDGHISLTHRIVVLVGRRNLILSFCEFVKNNFNLDISNKIYTDINGGSRITLYPKTAKKVLKLLYEKAPENIRLERKYNSALKLIS